MTYFHNVQQTRNSGLDREMRLRQIRNLFLLCGANENSWL